MQHSYKIGDSVDVIDLRDDTIVASYTTIATLRVETQDSAPVTIAGLACGFAVSTRCLRPAYADTLTRQRLIRVFQLGPQSVLPPSLHALTKADLRYALRLALRVPGSPVHNGMLAAFAAEQREREVA